MPRENNSWHYFLSRLNLDKKIGEHWKLNLEGRFVDEMAMSVGATYRF